MLDVRVREDRRTPAFLAACALVIVLGVTFGSVARAQLGAEREVAAEVAGRTIDAPATTVSVPVAAVPDETTTVAPTTTLPLPPLRTATLAFTGDTLAHAGVVRQARQNAANGDSGLEYDFGPMFERVAPYLADVDVAICHMETPLSPDNRNLSGYPTFNVPGDIGAALVGAGYDGCTTASNHSLDRRPEGIDDTLATLDRYGLAHSGMARSAEERADAQIYDAGGVAVASLSYSYGFNGFRVPEDEPWRANEIDVNVIAADAVAARAQGAEYVVVSLHWGTEYRHDPDTDQLDWAQAVAGIPEVDLIVGHHAHVVQPIDRIDGTYVVYGLGNFLSNQSANCCTVGAQDGLVVRVRLVEERAADGSTSFDTQLSWVPTRVDRSDFTIIPVVGESALEYVESRERTRGVINRLGIASWGAFEEPARSSEEADSAG